MKNQSVRSFQWNLKRMFLRYALNPVLELMLVALIIALAAGTSSIIRKNRQTSREISESLSRAFENYENLLTELSEFPEVVDPMTSSTKRQKIIRLLYQSSVETGYEADLYILDTDLNVCVSTEEDVQGNLRSETGKKWQILSRLENGNGETEVVVNSMGSDRRIHMGRAVRDSGVRTGYLVLSFSSREFSQVLSSHIQRNLLADQDGWVFESDSYTFVDAVGRLDKRADGPGGFRFGSEGCYYMTRTPVLGDALSVITITDFTDGAVVLATVLATCFIVLLVVFFVTWKSAERMAEKSTSDIRDLNAALKQVMDGNLDARLDLKSSTEFENIGRCYNGMLDSLKHQIEANRKLAEAVAYSRVKRLESQFNSHFIFNTLDNIRYMCRLDADLAEFMTVSLSELLRYNTSNTSEKVTVSEDLEHIRLYLEIVKVRFRERFDYRIDLEPGVENLLMPKLLLQPLIENSIKYGFGDREHLETVLEGRQKDGVLWFVCRDDGVGMDEELLKKITLNLEQSENQSAHLGLYNVHRRLRLIYGGRYGIRLENRNGVRVEVCLPAEPWEQPEKEFQENTDGNT